MRERAKQGRKRRLMQGYKEHQTSNNDTINNDTINNDTTDNTTTTLIHDDIQCINLMVILTLPWEIQWLVIRNLPRIGINELVVCSHWYYYGIASLYKHPSLTDTTFISFLQALTNNALLQNSVSELDLERVATVPSSALSRLVHRCSGKLLTLHAPSLNFSNTLCLVSLRQCLHLKVLDMGNVVFSNLSENSILTFCQNLLDTLEQLTSLESVTFPIDLSSAFSLQREYALPQTLKTITFSGNIINDAFLNAVTIPNTLRKLTLHHCNMLSEDSMYYLLSKMPHLQELTVRSPMNGLKYNSLDNVFKYEMELEILHADIKYCSKWLFSEYMLSAINARHLRLLYLELHESLEKKYKIHPDDLTIAVLEGRLSGLEGISISPRIGWDMDDDCVGDLVNTLDDVGAGLYVALK